MKESDRLLNPVNKTRLHEEIVVQLKDRIIRGDFAPGSKLPPERELAEQFNVNRTTVREALHKLESTELVEIKHGNGIYVKDFLESGNLELARDLLFPDGQVNIEVLENLLDLRYLLVPEISYSAALNRSEEDLNELERIVFESDEMPIQEKDWRVHNIIARASGNLLFVILLNSFTRLSEGPSRLYFNTEGNRRRSAEFHAEIYDAIKNRDAVRSRQIMADVLKYAETQTLAALGTDVESRED
jgi:GntR family transcriptional regulator, transcriptional repressor for pyruvate dehydrogenase complex